MARCRGLGLASAVLAIGLLTGAILPEDGPLLDAIKQGDVAVVRSLLQEGADPNAAQGDGLSALHLAAQDGRLDIAELLLSAGAEVDAKTKIGDYTPLHVAAGAARLSVVQALLAAGANPGAVTTTTGVTPLHLAAKALGGERAVRELAEGGAPVNAREASSGQTALMFAAAHGRTASVLELLTHGADPSITTEVIDLLKRIVVDREANQRLADELAEVRRSTPGGSERELTAAEEQRAIAAQRAFLRSPEQVAKVLEGFTPDQLSTRRPWWSLQNGVDQSLDTIVARPIRETLVEKTGGMTALLYAARDGQTEAAVALLDGGADIDQISGDGSTPLLLALLNGRYGLAMELIERGANPSLATNTDGVSPLFALLQTQWSLKFTYQPQPRAQDSQETEYMEVLTGLLHAGADPNAQLDKHLWHWEWEGKMGLDITGATPFWRAAFAQDLEAMKVLAAKGADPNIPTSWPEPGLRGNRQEDGRVAEDSGLPVMPEGSPNMYPVHAAAGSGYLGLGAFQQNNVPNNFLNVVKYMIEELGTDLNMPDAWGYTPLHYAAVRGDNPLIEYLVSKGADVNAITRLGQSVVDMTRGGRNGFFSRTPYPKTMELLLGLGSEFRCMNTHMRNKGDWCPGAGVAPFKDAVQAEGQVVKPTTR